MNLPDIFNSNTIYIKELLKANNLTENNNLTLTEKEAEEIISERNRVLKNQGRIELDIKITKKIIKFLCSSPYVNEDNYTDSILGLQEIFYYLKTETDDKLPDNSLLEIIFNLFDGPCDGSLELLRGREADRIINSTRFSQVEISQAEKGEIFDGQL